MTGQVLGTQPGDPAQAQASQQRAGGCLADSLTPGSLSLSVSRSPHRHHPSKLDHFGPQPTTARDRELGMPVTSMKDDRGDLFDSAVSVITSGRHRLLGSSGC